MQKRDDQDEIEMIGQPKEMTIGPPLFHAWP